MIQQYIACAWCIQDYLARKTETVFLRIGHDTGYTPFEFSEMQFKYTHLADCHADGMCENHERLELIKYQKFREERVKA